LDRSLIEARRFRIEAIEIGGDVELGAEHGERPGSEIGKGAGAGHYARGGARMKRPDDHSDRRAFLSYISRRVPSLALRG
jgi:hypothetical protein